MQSWSTADVESQSRYDAWAEALSGSHLPWALGAPASRRFDAAITSREVDGFSVVNCRCDPCSGERSTQQIRQADDAVYGILVLRDGFECVRQSSFETRLSKGDMLIWDASEHCAFNAPQSIAKTTLFITRDRLKAAIGHDALVTGPVDTRGGMGALLRDRILALDRILGDLDALALDRLAQSLVDEIAYLAQRGTPALVAPRVALMARIEKAMAARIDDPDLTPAALAAEVGISVRYLHQVFQTEQETVRERLLSLRLEAVASALRDPRVSGASVTQIAFANGFASASHLSRRFKDRFGATPTAYRRKYIH